MPLENHIAIQIAEFFRTLGDPTRVKLINELVNHEINVQTLAEKLGISQSAISHQLRILRQMHIVQTRRAGREIFYHLDDEHVVELFQKGVSHVLHVG